MSEPILSFLYNTSETDLPYDGSGGNYGNWQEIAVASTVSGVSDTKVYTGGGIHQCVETPTASFGRREATIRPSGGVIPIPQIYIESTNDNIMYHVPLASGQPNTNRYVFGVYIDGVMTSDLYLEMWDDNTFSTTTVPTLVGTLNFSHSVFNAIRTTDVVPPSDWNGGSANASYLQGYSERLGLMGSDSIQNEAVYYSMYAAIPWDLEFTHDQPIEGYRYLYV